MSTILIAIAIIFVISLFNFAKDSYNENDKIVKEGGIRIKYKELIDHFIDAGFRVANETNMYCCLVINNHAGQVVYHLQHTFSSISVTFEMKNAFLGEQKLEWDFPETMSQKEIAYQIDTRTRQFVEKRTTQLYNINM